MEAVKTYILSVTAAALICGIVLSIMGKKGTLAQLGKVLCGIFLSVTVIAPLTLVRINSVDGWLQDLSLQAQDAVVVGEGHMQNQLRQSIIEKTEAYILDKAAAMSAQISVEVTLSNEDPPMPCAVCVTGSVSPYARGSLEQILTDDLGIPREAQTWIG